MGNGKITRIGTRIGKVGIHLSDASRMPTAEVSHYENVVAALEWLQQEALRSSTVKGQLGVPLTYVYPWYLAGVLEWDFLG